MTRIARISISGGMRHERTAAAVVEGLECVSVSIRRFKMVNLAYAGLILYLI